MNNPSATLRELAGEPAVLCETCRERPPARGYSDCVQCTAEFLRDNPDELAVFVAVDDEDRTILAMATEQLRKTA